MSCLRRDSRPRLSGQKSRVNKVASRTRAALPTFARMDSRGRLSLRVLYESFAGFKNFFDQLGCGRFHIASQHTLGTGGAK